MYLKRIELFDWKAYGNHHVFEFPRPTKSRNVILIGAKNGYGKTSLLEAIIFGLFGRDGLSLAARADQLGDDERRRQSYADFVEKAFYERAIAEGRTEMSVSLSFIGEDDDGVDHELTLERSWSFTMSGALRPDGETLAITVDGEEVLAPRTEDPDEFFRGLIARETVPPNLAPFFLFDGEQVQSLAKREMASQVRHGIEGFLGATIMKELARDLRAYGRKKSSEVGGLDDGRLNVLREQLEAKEAELEDAERRKAKLDERHASLERHQADIQGRITGRTGGAITTVRQLSEKLKSIEVQLDRMRNELADMLAGDFALALAGDRVRNQLSVRLDAEIRLSQHEQSVAASSGRISQFSTALAAAPPHFEPPLTDTQIEALQRKIEAAWQSLWSPPPEGCAPEHRHGFLSDLDKRAVADRLRNVDALGQEQIETTLGRIESLERDRSRVKADLQRYMSFESDLDGLNNELNGLRDQLSEVNDGRRELERLITALTSDVTSRRAEYQKEVGRLASNAGTLNCISLAERIANMLEPFVEDAIGAQVDELAERMTEAFREMAHKSYVEKIAIDRECNVALLSKSGADIRGLDQSAGENQVFAFSLISAIAQAAAIEFPIIIDTPLARLDEQHRLRILKHFTHRAGEQIILLTQDTEVVDKYYAAIQSRVAREFLIENEAKPGARVGRARVLADRYFE